MSLGVALCAVLAAADCAAFTGEARAPAPAAIGATPVSGHTTPAADAYRNTVTLNVDETTLRKGAAIFERACAQCHLAGVARAPQLFILEQMAPESIYRALTSGIMQSQGKDLGDAEKRAVAEFLARRKLGADPAGPAVRACEGDAAGFDRDEPPLLHGWGFDAANTHFIPDDVAGIDRNNVGRLKLKWAFGFPNAARARSQPALAGGAIFVGSHDGTVYALDRESGCARWTFRAGSEVRTGIVVSPWKAGDTDAVPLAYFGDFSGNAYAVEAFSGELVWRMRADDHPGTVLTGTPTLAGDRLLVPVSSLEEGLAVRASYLCCTFRGSMIALDAATGEQRWRRYFVDPPGPRGTPAADGKQSFGPSGVPMWSTAAVDEVRGQVYVTLGDNYSSPATSLSDAIVAVALDTGEVRWAYQALANDAWNGSCDELDRANCPEEDGPDFDFGAGAVLVNVADGRDIVVAGAKSGVAFGVDPDTGSLLWRERIGRGGALGGIHFGLAAAGSTVYVPVSDAPDGREHDMPARPGLYALEAGTGAYRWQAPSQDRCNGRAACHPGFSGAVTATSQLVLAGANDGWLMAYDAADGKVLWEIDTTREWDTVNGVQARGGSMGGSSAPVAWKGTLIMNSGYGFTGKMPGNVLLVFEVAPAAR